MKIAIIGSRGYPYVYGGFETFVKELSERLVEQNVEVHVYCQKNLFNQHPPQVNGIFLHYIPTLPQKSLNQIVHSFLSIVHATFSKADVLLVVNLAAGPMGWIPKITGKKTMINVDGLEWLRPKWKGLGAKYFYWAARLATKMYDKIITDAEGMRQIYLKEFNKDSTVIAYGAPKFKVAESHWIDQLDLKPNEYYLIVGRLIPDNNADLIISGFLKSKSKKKLVVVGDVPYRDKYASELKAMQSDCLIFLGYIKNQEELLALYQNAFAYLHGHKFGGTNPAMLKAMANNCAILALDTVFNREMLNEGEFGLFFDEDDLSIAASLENLENEPIKVLNFKDKVCLGLTEKYNWDNITLMYKQEILNLTKFK
jgi:glycosyltransferase involved in cell wall biosynthesis